MGENSAREVVNDRMQVGTFESIGRNSDRFHFHNENPVAILKSYFLTSNRAIQRLNEAAHL